MLWFFRLSAILSESGPMNGMANLGVEVFLLRGESWMRVFKKYFFCLFLIIFVMRLTL